MGKVIPQSAETSGKSIQNVSVGAKEVREMEHAAAPSGPCNTRRMATLIGIIRVGDQSNRPGAVTCAGGGGGEVGGRAVGRICTRRALLSSAFET